jgi:hypothetical protein
MCAGGGGAGASFRTGPGGGGFGLGEGAGGGRGDDEVEGGLEGVAEDACSFASRFIRIWGNTGPSQRLLTMVMRGRDTYAVGIIGGIGQRLARAHDLQVSWRQIEALGLPWSLVSLPDEQMGPQSQMILYNHLSPTCRVTVGRFCETTTMTMFSVALFSAARQFPRLFSSSATFGYPKLKTHSGSKKRWRAIASGAFKRVSSFPSVLPAG